MSLRHPRRADEKHGFPRVSGDEPEPGLILLEGTEFSPRERG